MPCVASTTSSAPSHEAMARETSYEKSTCPGVSIRLSVYSCPSRALYSIWIAWLLMVMPFSRSRSISSSTCACISRWFRVLVFSNRRSANVLLPWSMWAMMQKLRMFFIYSSKNVCKYTNYFGFPGMRPPCPAGKSCEPDFSFSSRRYRPAFPARPGNQRSLLRLPSAFAIFAAANTVSA